MERVIHRDQGDERDGGGLFTGLPEYDLHLPKSDFLSEDSDHRGQLSGITPITRFVFQSLGINSKMPTLIDHEVPPFTILSVIPYSPEQLRAKPCQSIGSQSKHQYHDHANATDSTRGA